MAPKQKLKNAIWKKSDEQAKNIMESILKKVYGAIDVRIMAEKVVDDIVEDAMYISNETTLQLKLQQNARSKMNASLRRDLLVIDYRRNPELRITNPVNGQVYTVSLRLPDMPQLESVGYDVSFINPGTTKHVYAALRAVIPDLQRSTSLRIWYTNDNGECIVIPCNDMSVLGLIGIKLYVAKLWGSTTPALLEDEEASELE